jgi:hypothetical protein
VVELRRAFSVAPTTRSSTFNDAVLHWRGSLINDSLRRSNNVPKTFESDGSEAILSEGTEDGADRCQREHL